MLGGGGQVRVAEPWNELVHSVLMYGILVYWVVCPSPFLRPGMSIGVSTHHGLEASILAAPLASLASLAC